MLILKLLNVIAGTNYIQNVLPNGPSVWVVWQIIERVRNPQSDVLI